MRSLIPAASRPAAISNESTACERLLADDDLRLQIAADARARALDLFQIDQMLQAFRGIYTSTLANAPREAPQAPLVKRTHGAHARPKRSGRHLRLARS